MLRPTVLQIPNLRPCLGVAALRYVGPFPPKTEDGHGFAGAWRCFTPDRSSASEVSLAGGSRRVGGAGLGRFRDIPGGIPRWRIRLLVWASRLLDGRPSISVAGATGVRSLQRAARHSCLRCLARLGHCGNKPLWISHSHSVGGSPERPRDELCSSYWGNTGFRDDEA